MDFKRWFEKNRWYLTSLSLLVIVAYLNSLSSDFVADDIPGILQNTNINQFSFVFSTPPVFVKNILYFLVASIFGITPAAFRTINILFHLGNVWILYLLLSLLINRKTAIIASAIMAVHPIQTEAVTWISAGHYSQYSFFVLLTLLLCSLSWKDEKFLVPAMISLVVAFLTMQIAIFLPLILLAFTLSFQNLKKEWKLLVIPFILSGIWTILAIERISQRMVDIQTKHYQSLQLLNPLVQIPTAISSYLELIFWPKGLTLYHTEMSFSSIEYYSRLLVFLAFLGVIAYAFKKNRQVFFWLSFFLIALLPTLNPLGISWIVAERYAYLGAIGIFVVVAMGIKKIGERLGNPNLSYAILIPILLVLTARTIIRNNDWKNQDTLWLATAKTSPSSPQNHNNLGDLYGRRGDLERSAAEFKKAIELNPNYADAYHNLGNTYLQMERVGEAIESFKKAAEINPGLWQSYQNLAAIYFEQGNFELAKEWMEKAVAANPENPNLQHNLEIINKQLSNP